jgi:UDP-N-acetylmuramoylalanine--D-glutamate ligase
LKKREGVLTGHVPISAMYAMIGVLCAALYDYAYVTVGNEASSNFGNVEHDGMIVNHQWSKSSVFERSYQAYLRASASDSVVYFSLLRPFHELRIAQLFSRYPEYFQTFASCNRNFAIDPTQRPTGKWCCSCPKCAFVFLMLAPFMPRDTLVGIFGKNMLELKELEQLFGDILGFGTVKPFDCVGTFTEARAALYAVRDAYADTYIACAFVPKITDGVEAYAESMHTYPTPTIPTPFVFAGMRSAALLGYGLEGKTTEAFLKLAHPSCMVTVLDEKQGADLERDAVAYDIAVRSPGVPLSKVSIQYTTATNLFFSLCRDTHTIVAVTGSKGKSTTSALIHHLLKEGGKASVLIGNAGVPVLSEYMKGIPQETVIVVELSSYQLEDMQYAPHIALVTSLFPDHIPHHGSVDVYYEAKHRMVQNQRPEDVYVYDPACARAAQWAAEAPGKTVAYEPALPIPFGETQLIGAHNEANMRGAVTVARMLDVPEEAIGRGLRSFVGLRHRLEHIGTFKDILFYDDAIATTPEATIAALNALGTVDTIFLGGEDRGYDFSELARVLGKHGVKNVVLFPDSGERIGLDPTEFTILKTRSMKEAVNFAYEHTPAGGVCLLSCASPSYTLWKNFEEKGDDFTREVTSHA